MQPSDEPLDVAKVRAEAESWLKTYASDPQPTPSMAWPWLNGRCHPSIVLALCERIADLEGRSEPPDPDKMTPEERARYKAACLAWLERLP